MDEAIEAKTVTSDSDFVIAWQTANNADEVAEALNLKRASVIQRACGLRNRQRMRMVCFQCRVRRPSGIASRPYFGYIRCHRYFG